MTAAFPIVAADERCALCRTPLVTRHSTYAFLCASALCASRLAAMPASHKCRQCSRPLPAARWGLGICDESTCQVSFVSRRVREEAQRREAKQRRASIARRNRAAAQLGIPANERDSYLVAVVPHNTNRLSRLPAERREFFLNRLRANLAEARARFAAGDTPLPRTILTTRKNGRSEAEQQAEWDLLGAGCGVCRGNCCKQGGDHAFNTSDTMMWYLLEHPSDDDDTIIERYEALIPTHSLTKGCLFQEETGCALPRNLRSDVCNRFYCEYINVLRNQYEAGQPVRAYYLHMTDQTLHGGRFVEIKVRRDGQP